MVADAGNGSKGGEPAVAGGEGEPVGTRGTIALGMFFVLASFYFLYLLLEVWPAASPTYANQTVEVALFPGGDGALVGLERGYLLLVIASGGLGSYVASATSFATYVGNRRLNRSWVWWYLLRVFIGITLALVLYFAVRGGLLSAGAGADVLSPFGVAALAGLTGMFSRQATDKLAEVFETLFQTEDEVSRADGLQDEPGSELEQPVLAGEDGGS